MSKSTRKSYHELFFALAASLLSSVRPSPTFEQVIESISQGLELERSILTACKRIFAHALSSGGSVEQYASDFHNEFCKREHVLAKALIGLLQLCARDDTIPKNLDDNLRKIAKCFDFSLDEYEVLRANFVQGELSTKVISTNLSIDGQSEDELLAILGCTNPVSNNEIRRVYRRLALSHHPDIYQAITDSSELKKDIELRFRQISLAYEKLKKIRKIS